MQLENFGFDRQAIEALLRAKTNPAYFIHNFVKIQHPVNGVVPFELTDYQIRYVNAIKDNRKVLSLTPRQIGGTSIATAIALHTAIFEPYQNVVIMGNSQNACQEHRDRVVMMLESLPKFMHVGIRANNRNSIEFDNGSRIAFAMTGNQLRGMAINFLILDQPFFFKKQEELLEMVLPCIHTHGRFLGFGTPNKGAFYDLFQRAEKGETDILAYRFNITEFPTDKFLSQRQWLGEEAFRREFLCEIE
jgi:hypothetical protein